MLVANFVAHCLWRHARDDGLLYACSAEERRLEVTPGEKLGVWAELHDQYSPAARCRSKLRFWVSLKVAYVFICEECRGMRTGCACGTARSWPRSSEQAEKYHPLALLQKTITR